jgi:hypothetical protein
MRIVFRPLTEWPGQLRTDAQRKDSPFTASWTDTMDLLEREARLLGAREIVLQIAIPDSQIRSDGWPYARAKAAHPAVTVVLPESNAGRVSFSTDRYNERGFHGYLSGWQANLRAIALSMEALRAADRHGVTQGRQYAGFRELGSGIAAQAHVMTVEDAARFLIAQGDLTDLEPDEMPLAIRNLIDYPDARVPFYRVAAKRLHPDAGGDSALFQRLQEAKRLLDEHAGTRQ